MEKVVRIFASFEEADEADRQAYDRMSPQERIEMLLALRRMMVKEGDESAERLERVLTVVEFPRLSFRAALHRRYRPSDS
jgi:hypothetical protein